MEFTKQEVEMLMASLNATLKNEPNALQAATVLVPLAMKVQKLAPVEAEPKVEGAEG